MRYAIITDIHEDIINLQKAFKLIEKKNCDEIICLGDICGFSIPYYRYLDTRNASQCIQLIKSNCKYVVIGNHDLYAIKKLPKNISVFNFPENWYSLSFEERTYLSNDKIWLYEDNELSAMLTNNDIEYLDSLPELIVLPTQEYNILLTHYISPDITGCTKTVYEKSCRKTHSDFVKSQNSKLSICGHIHPSGILSRDGLKRKGIISSKLNYNDEIDWFAVPAIAQGNCLNGFAILDTETNTVESINLKSLINLF